MKFESNSIDDIIEHILTRLNTDYAGGCLDVPDFCQKDGNYDRILEMRVRTKMYQHGVAFRCSGTGQPDTAIELTAKGAEVYENGGWKKYLIEFEKQNIEEQNKKEQFIIATLGIWLLETTILKLIKEIAF